MNEHDLKYQSYYTGTMTPEEKAVFEKELASDSAIQKEYRAFVFTYEAEESLVAQKLKDKMKNWKEKPPVFTEPQEDTPVISIDIKKRFALWQIAAAFVGLLSVTVLIWNNLSSNKHQSETNIANYGNDSTQTIVQIDSSSYKPEDLPSQEKKIVDAKRTIDNVTVTPIPEPEILAYAEISNDLYDEPTHLYSNLKSDNNTDLNNKYNQALQLFKNKDFKKALKQLGNASKNEESTLAYLRGHIYYNLKDYAAAVTCWKPISEDELLPLHNEARWQLLLAYTAQLPNSKAKWDSLVKTLQTAQDFDYRKELDVLMNKVKEK